MEVNLNSQRAAEWSARQEALGAQEGLDAGGEKPGASTASRLSSAGLSISESPASPEDVSAASLPESALSRNDDLGKLVSSAFALPAPPMPNFTP